MFLFLMIGKIIKLPIATAVWAKRKILQNDKPVPEEVESFPYDPQRRIFLQRGIIVLTGVTFTGAMYGTFRRDNYDIVYQSIGVKNLPPEFNGFTITLVADIHSSMFMSKERMEEYKLVVNSLGSDLILVPGDFVTMSI